MPENQSPAARSDRKIGDFVGLLLLLLFSPLILLWLFFLFLRTVVVHLAVLLLWVPRRRSVLFLYSESPVWQAHIEENVLPRLPPSSVVLNWSRRRLWRRFDIAVWIFRHYGGDEEFNPLGIIIRPFRRVKVFRFWKPFRDLKHGKPHALDKIEARFLEEIGAV